MQEQQIRQLEHHAEQLRDSLQAGGVIPEGGGAGGGGAAEETRNRGADGDLP